MLQRDRGQAGIWIMIAIVLLGGFTGWRFFKAHLDHEKLKEAVTEAGLRGLKMPRADYESEILDLFEAHSIAFDEDEVELTMDRPNQTLMVYVPYTRNVDLLVMKWPMHYAVDKEIVPKEGTFMQDIREDVEDSYEQGAQRAQDALNKLQD